MTARSPCEPNANEPERYELTEALPYHFTQDRRLFLQTVAGGFLLLAVSGDPAFGQRRGAVTTLDARLRFSSDGIITVLNGKVEEGQGARTELAMAAAEELRVPVSRIYVQMADTDITPDDWITAGSNTTPATASAIREASAAARDLLRRFAAKKWGIEATHLVVESGRVMEPQSRQSVGYADMAQDTSLLRDAVNIRGVTVRPPTEWTTLGKPLGRVNGRDIVTGAHHFPSDIQRPNMLYGAVVRPPAYGAKLTSLAKSTKFPEGVKMVQDKDFVGFVANTAFAARQAAEFAAASATWDRSAAPQQSQLWESFRKSAKGNHSVADEDIRANWAKAAVRIEATFEVPYIQHAPMEPRAAVAEWNGRRLTVWTGTSGPFRVRQDLADAFGLSLDQVRVIVPDFGGGFGGKHTGEAAMEAARLAREVNRPVALRWTRQEEFAWAYCRPAALIDIRAGIDHQGSLCAWEFVNFNAGAAGLRSPYRAGALREEFLRTDTPLRQGSYRALASTANNFARETLMDELAKAAGKDPLAFRLAHMKDHRLRVVLEAVAERFGWEKRQKNRRAGRGLGIACGNEKNSVVATCVEVEVDAMTGIPRVLELCQAYECGAILNPAGLLQQSEGAILMGLGAVLREEIHYANGIISNGRFRQYRVPRMADVPKLDLLFLDRKNAPSNGAGETPIIGIAPAVANAVFALTGDPVRKMPIRAAKQAA